MDITKELDQEQRRVAGLIRWLEIEYPHEHGMIKAMRRTLDASMYPETHADAIAYVYQLRQLNIE